MKISLWDSKALLILLAAGQGANLVYASVVLDGASSIADPMFWLALIKGLTLGVAVSFSASYAGFQLPRVRHKKAGPIGWASLGVSVLCSAVVVAFCSAQPPEGWQRWVVSAAYAGMVESSVLAVAMASGKMFVDEPAEPAQSKPKAEPKPVKPAPVFACKYGCGFERATSQALNPHYGACKNNPKNKAVESGQEAAQK